MTSFRLNCSAVSWSKCSISQKNENEKVQKVQKLELFETQINKKKMKKNENGDNIWIRI